MNLTDSLKRLSGRKLLPMVVVFSVLLLSGCGARALSPAGPAARRIANIWWLMLGMSGVILLIVLVALGIALFRRRDAEAESERSVGKTLMLWGGIIIPVVTVITLMAFNVDAMVDVTDPLDEGDILIEVTGHMWWWDVTYPQYEIRTANEIHIPVGTPVAVELTSTDVIHSFWVPELHGKRDLMPGTTVPYWLQADRPGVYEGQCAEFCGMQHAKMLLRVIAHEPADFEAWLEREQQDAPEPTDALAEEGRDVFLESACAGCHTVSGTTAEGTAGPDLTHFGSRQTIGAGILANTPENLRPWIINAQAFKPGVAMPPMPMPQDELDALVEYLQSLE